MAETKTICCCGAATWAAVIGWLQIIINSIGVLIAILALAGVANISAGDKELDGHLKGAVVAILVIALLLYIVGIAFGALLLKGTNDRRPAYLRAWMVFAAILLVWAIIGAAVGSGDLGYRVVQCIIEVVIYSFGIWVIYTLKEEIEHESRVGQVN